MRYFFISIIVLTLGVHSAWAIGSSSLAPSLMDQMQRQTLWQQQVDRDQKKQALIDKRQQALAAKKVTTKTGVTTNVTLVTHSKTPVDTRVAMVYPPIVPPVSMDSAPVRASQIPDPVGVNMSRVRDTWLSWTNTTRTALGLSPYTLESRLNSTATEWSEFSRNRGYIIHGRPGDGCVGAMSYGCYNYTVIDAWFQARGINPIVKNRAKHTENIGYGSYRCSSGDCTDALISAIRKTYDFYLSEKGRSYDVHYRSIIQPNFSKIGVGVVVDTTKSTYYLTVHYITE